MDLDLDARIPGGERLAQLEPVLAMPGDRDANREPTGRLDRLADRERLLGGVKRDLRLTQELTPGIGELHPTRHAHQQRHTELLLQMLELARERGLSDEQPGRRTPDVALLSNHDEGPEMPEIDSHGRNVFGAAQPW